MHSNQESRRPPSIQFFGARARKSLSAARGFRRGGRAVAGFVVLAVVLASIVVALAEKTNRPNGADRPAETPDDNAGTTVHALTGSPPTLAVLPFELLGDGPGQLYLARGLAAELTASLSQLSGLTVIGTSPIGTGILGDRPSLAAAQYRLWGGVQRKDEDIRLHLVIIETATGEQIWSQRYERPSDQLLSLADELTTALAEALVVTITTAENRRLAQRRTNSADAYDLFLRAQTNLLLRREAENQHARDLYLRALALDPSFARALGGIALTHAADYRNRWSEDGEAALTRARDAAQEAARIDPDVPEVLWVLAYVHVRDADHAQALVYLDRTLALDPSFADAYALKASAMTYMGAPEESVPLLNHAMRLNPRAGYLYYLISGRAMFYLGDYEQAVRNLREAISRNPANLEAHLYQAASLWHSGDRDGAEWQALEVINLDPDFSLPEWLKTHPIRGPGQRTRLISALDGLSL